MAALDDLARGIKHVEGLLAERVLEPDPARTDWASMKERVKLLARDIDADVLGVADAAIEEAEEDALKSQIRRRVAGLACKASVPIRAAGDRAVAAQLLKRALALSDDPEQKALLRAAGEELEVHMRLVHGDWLGKEGLRAEADKEWKRVAREAKSPALKADAMLGVNAPRPITSAPALFRLNGCGVGLYGERDRDEEGWYVATYFISLLWIPVFPLTAYRVQRSGAGYRFIAQERLGPIARAWRIVVGVLGAGAIAFYALTSYYDSPTHKANVGLAEARAMEAKGDRRGALEKYTTLVREYGAGAGGLRDRLEADSNMSSAAEAIVRLSAQAVTEPATIDSSEAIGRVVTAFDGLPVGARAGAATEQLTAKLVAWAQQIGDADEAHARAALGVLDLISSVTTSAPSVDARRHELRSKLADRIAPARPLAALALYATAPIDAAAADKAFAILAGFDGSPSLLVEAEVAIQELVHRLPADPRTKTLTADLAAARDAEHADAAFAETADEPALAKALAEKKNHQALALALAGKQRARGDTKAALATLTALGDTGHLATTTQLVLAATMADAGDAAHADEVLTTFVDDRLPGYLAAQRKYSAAARALQDRLINEAKSPNPPADLEARARGADEKDMPEIFSVWLRSRITKDPELERLKGEFLRYEAVVPASLTLGRVKLARVQQAKGDEKKKLLADTERVFLSIRSEAEGEPSFHLGLGQVYQRLGKTQEAAAQFKIVLDKKQPELALAVAHTYRELGLIKEAKATAEAVLATGDEKQRYAAALFLAHVVDDLDEEERWLQKCDQKSPYVREILDEVAAKRALRAGKLADADRGFAKVAQARENATGHDATASNNTAMAYCGRFDATGDVAHLKTAVRHLEDGLRLAPDSSLVMGNLATILEQQALVTVFEKWLSSKTLALGIQDAKSVAAVLATGSLREPLIEALKQNAAWKRARELGQQEEVLAPQRTSAYEREHDWLKWTRDEPGLAAFATGLAGLSAGFDQDALESRKKYWSGERDDDVKRSILASAATTSDRVARATAGGNKPTLAVAWMLRAEALSTQMSFDRDPAHAAELVEAYKHAVDAWPESGMRSLLAEALSEAAIVRAASKSPELGAALKKEGRMYDVRMTAYRASQGTGGGAVLAAVRAEPELAEAAKVALSELHGRPGVTDWLLAKLAGDAELEAAAKPAFERADLLSSIKVGALLEPGSPRDKAELELMTRGPR